MKAVNFRKRTAGSYSVLFTVIFAILVGCGKKSQPSQSQSSSSQPRPYISDYRGVAIARDASAPVRIKAVVEIRDYGGREIFVLHPFDDHKLAGIELVKGDFEMLRAALARLKKGDSLIAEGLVSIRPVFYEWAIHPLYDPVANCESSGAFSLSEAPHQLRVANLPQK